MVLEVCQLVLNRIDMGAFLYFAHACCCIEELCTCPNVAAAMGLEPVHSCGTGAQHGGRGDVCVAALGALPRQPRLHGPLFVSGARGVVGGWARHAPSRAPSVDAVDDGERTTHTTPDGAA